jgi:hypothetical protein
VSILEKSGPVDPPIPPLLLMVIVPRAVSYSK